LETFPIKPCRQSMKKTKFEINMKIYAESCNLFYKKAYNLTNNVGKDEHTFPYLFYGNKRKRLRLKSNKCNLSFGSGFVFDNRPLIISLPKHFIPVAFAGSCVGIFQNTPFAYWHFVELPCWRNYVPVRTIYRNS
jgi:hypothetical protein